MATRRMFSKTITNSSRFLMMPQSAQNLYFHLGMNADDDGFCEHFTIMRMTESKPDDLRILQAKGFVKIFDDRVLIITQWKENNYIRSDRYTPSKYLEIYKEELKRLSSGTKIKTIETNEKKPKWLKDREKARKEGDLPFSFDYKIRKAFWGKKCIVCGEIMGSSPLNRPSIQHNVPFSKGGKHSIDNISVICESCSEKMKGNISDKTNTEEVKRIWQTIVSNRETQVRLGKDRLDKVSIGKKRLSKDTNIKAKQSFAEKKQIDELIDLFKKINPSYKRFFGNKTERAALQRLLKQYGREKLEKIINTLPQVVGKPYAPTITSPWTLENKMANLIIFLQKERSEEVKYKAINLNDISLDDL